MQVIHSHGNKRIDEHVERDVAFLITNKKGGYLSLGEKNFTHMQGLFFFDEAAWSPYKTVENIRLDRKIVGIRNRFSSVERFYEGGADELFTIFNNSMHYELKNYTGDLTLELDFRHMFDFSDQGRIYTVMKEGDDTIVIRYDKFSDHDLSRIERTRYLVIKGAKAFHPIGNWEKKSYAYDARRHSRSEAYTYTALSIPVNQSINLSFTFSDSKEAAKEEASHVFENKQHYLHSMDRYMTHTFSSDDIALDVAMKALDDLLVTVEGSPAGKEQKEQVKRTGIFAGLPWFYQFWSRDELVSIRALILHGKYQRVKTILFSYLEHIGEDGLLPNRLPHSDLRSMDAVGWLFVRLHDFLAELAQKKMIDKHLTISDLIKIKQGIEKAVQGLTHKHAKDGFITGKIQESWMDTKEARRSGSFIESQAFLLAMLRLHNEIAKVTNTKPLFRITEREFAEKVKAAYFKNGVLLDTIGGELAGEDMRPNVFLAHYIYPDLLTTSEWKQVFDSALKALWLDWGGVATLSHNNPQFCVEYSGEGDKSYHNGDSWYYINNIAAMEMNRLDRIRYAKYVDRIKHASREELLFSGFIGCSAELSSAKELRSEGSLSQAWSAATFVELMHELKD